MTCHNCQVRHHLAVCKPRHKVKSTSLQPNAPSFQTLQPTVSADGQRASYYRQGSLLPIM